jgi:hypothetical protein
MILAMWTVGKPRFIHQIGFNHAIFWRGTERGSFKTHDEAQNYCDRLNAQQGCHLAHVEDYLMTLRSGEQ